MFRPSMTHSCLDTCFELGLNGGSWEGYGHVCNRVKSFVNDVTILTNRFETYYELAKGMMLEVMLKSCLKCVQLCINRF